MKKCIYILAGLLAVALLFGCSPKAGEKPVTEDIASCVKMNESFSVAGIEAKVTAAYVNSLEPSPVAENKTVIVEIEYDKDKLIESKYVSLSDLYGKRYSFFSMDGLDYLGVTRPQGKTPFIRFNVPKTDSKFVLYLDLPDAAEPARVYIELEDASN